jgi:hypothetical protein
MRRPFDGGAGVETALDRYVARPDDAYRFERAALLQGEGYTAHVLDLVSQRWRSPWEVDRIEWRHWLTIVVPTAVRHRTALLWIGGGENGDARRPTPPSARCASRSRPAAWSPISAWCPISRSTSRTRSESRATKTI